MMTPPPPLSQSGGERKQQPGSSEELPDPPVMLDWATPRKIKVVRAGEDPCHFNPNRSEAKAARSERSVSMGGTASK